MRKVYETGTIENIFEFARQEVSDLQDEMEDVADRMPEQLGTAHAAAAQLLGIALNSIYDCDVPPNLCDVEVRWADWKGKIYRPQRRDNVVNFLRAYLAQIPQTDDAKKLRADLQYTIDALKNVYFPGMSGRRAA